MAHDWESLYEEGKTTPLPLPPEIAQKLYEVYAYYNDERVKTMERMSPEMAEAWDEVSELLYALKRAAEEAVATSTPVDVPLLMLNPKYDVVLKDFFGPRLRGE